jgi:hypothetical protein
MTSKEALKDIKNTYYDFFTLYNREQFDIIEKDLEILEIIKKINKTDLLHFFAITIKNETEFNLIKEWLEKWKLKTN